MVSKPISFGSLHFTKKKDAEVYLQTMLRKYDVGDRVNVADAEVLRAALARHPDAAAKVGCGITHFSVGSADFGTKCFWVNRTDGSTDNFSFRSCVYV